MGNLLKVHRDRDRLLQLLVFNEEFLVDVVHQTASITSLPFVHTARRSYRLNDPVRPPDCGAAAGSPAATPREAVRTLSFRGRRSRNKVSVGEPAEGSFAQRNVLFHPPRTTQCFLFCHQENFPSRRCCDLIAMYAMLSISCDDECLGSRIVEGRSELC